MVNQKTCAGPLAGIRAIDLCDEKGAFCTKLLSDLGADVIKVHLPHHGPEAGRQPVEDFRYFYQNTNKRAIILNYLLPAGRDLLVDLVAKSDVVVESFAPGFLDRIGLGFDSLRKQCPDVIMASITWFGQTGPRKEDAACDLTIAAAGGQTHITGDPDLPPIAPFGEQSDYIGSLYAAVGILLALQDRGGNGHRAKHIDISLQEAIASTLDHVWPRYFHAQEVAQRSGGRHWNDLFTILPCKDGFIHLTPFLHWHTLVDWLDGEGMAQDLTEAQWKEEDYRVKHADHVHEVLAEWSRTHTVDELFHLGQLMGFPWAPVNTLPHVLASKQLQSRNFFKQAKTPDGMTTFTYPGVPYRFKPRFDLPEKGAPRQGKPNGEVYDDLFGLAQKDMVDLSSKGVI